MKPTPRAPRLLPLLAAFACAASAQAAMTLRDANGLAEALKDQPPCCVVDARSEASRRKHPLPDAVRYRPGLKIVPTAAVVVVGDDDKGAAKAGEALARQHPGKDIIAVKGGVAAWEAAFGQLAAPAVSKGPGASRSLSFVIPHNTCETGTPLQVLKSKPRP